MQDVTRSGDSETSHGTVAAPISASSTTPHNKSSLSEFTWVAGAGAELALDDRVSLGAEALYYGETGTFSAGDDSGKIDGIWVGRVRLSVKIGG